VTLCQFSFFNFSVLDNVRRPEPDLMTNLRLVALLNNLSRSVGPIFSYRRPMHKLTLGVFFYIL